MTDKCIQCGFKCLILDDGYCCYDLPKMMENYCLECAIRLNEFILDKNNNWLLNREHMKIESFCAIIPARKNSKGLINKNMKLMNGNTLISYSLNAGKNSKLIDRLFVSTDSDLIKEESEKYDVEIIDRPKELGLDNTSIYEIIEHAKIYFKKINYKPSHIIILQPTSPLRTSKDIDKAISIYLKNDFETLVSVKENIKPINWNLRKSNNYLRPIFKLKDLKKRRQEFEKSYYPNGAIFISNIKYLEKNNSFYCNKIGYYVMDKDKSIDIDDEFDFELSELLLRIRN